MTERSSLQAKLVGRGTIQRRLDGGGVEGAGAGYPTPMLRMVPLPIVMRWGGTHTRRYRHTSPGTNGGQALALIPARRSQRATQLLQVRTALS